MTARLQAELRRLYGGDAAVPAATPGPDGNVQAFVLELAGPAAWDALAPAWQGVQADLELPAPGIAVSGVDAYQLWFSVAQAVPAAQAQAFLQALRRRYLAEVPADRIRLHPGPDAAPALPPLERTPGCWSAFIAPDLASIFADERWLDVPPNQEAQADLLARLRAATPAEWARALQRLAPQAAPAGTATAPMPAPASALPAPSDDPRRFLVGVMNDPAVAMPLRIEAAKALLAATPGARHG